MLTRTFRYLWASPATALGLVFVPLAWLSRGEVLIVRGAIEVHGFLVEFFLRKVARASAMTLGHVILGCDPIMLDVCRDHEHVHIQQYERWGPFLIPVYLLCSAYLFLIGRRAYRDNPFEREAYGD